MTTRSTQTALVVSLLAFTTTGCGLFCGIEQWKCDTFGTCGFGTQPSYGRFAPPGPMPPATINQQPQLGAPGGTFAPGPVLGPPQDLTPSSPQPVPSF